MWYVRTAIIRVVCFVVVAGAISMPFIYDSTRQHAAAARKVSPNERLIEAALAGDLWEVRAALEAGASPDARCRAGMTPLMSAAARGDLATVRVLLEHGASVDATERYGNTAVVHATMFGHEDVAELLLQRQRPAAADLQ